MIAIAALIIFFLLVNIQQYFQPVHNPIFYPEYSSITSIDDSAGSYPLGPNYIGNGEKILESDLVNEYVAANLEVSPLANAPLSPSAINSLGQYIKEKASQHPLSFPTTNVSTSLDSVRDNTTEKSLLGIPEHLIFNPIESPNAESTASSQANTNKNDKQAANNTLNNNASNATSSSTSSATSNSPYSAAEAKPETGNRQTAPPIDITPPPPSTIKPADQASLPANLPPTPQPPAEVGRLNFEENNSGGFHEEIRAFIVPEQEVVLASQFVAQIDKIFFKEGDHFKKDDPIVSFRCEKQTAEYEMAKHEYLSAQHSFNAQVALSKLDAGSALELHIARENYRRTAAALKTYDHQKSLCVIRAPFNGLIHKIKAQPYEVITVGQPLVETLKEKGLKIHLLVPSTWATHIRQGQKFFVHIDDLKQMYQARVQSISPKIDPLVRSIEVIGTFIKPDKRIVPGMSGSAHFKKISGGK